jgi:ribosomal protein S18 acetylase RimI-like enzyme
VAADLDAVGEVHARARGAAYAGIVPADALDAVSGAAMGQWWAARWEYEQDTHRMAVAHDEAGAVVGFAYVGPSEVPGTGELYAIHVEPARQGGGIGRALMDWAVRTLAELGHRRAVLWVLTDNASARRFYERAGWRADGVGREAPLGPAMTRQRRYCRTLLNGLDGST